MPRSKRKETRATEPTEAAPAGEKSKEKRPNAENPTAERRTLKDRTIQSLEPAPKGCRYEYPDAVVRELMVRVGDTGRRSWAVVARFPAGSRFPVRRSLGTYLPPAKPKRPPREARDIPAGVAMTLVEARNKARSWLDMVAQGIDPKVEAEKEKARNLQRQANGFAAVAADFTARKVKGPALCELEDKAAQLRESKPNLSEREALAQMLADPKNKDLVARSERESLAKWKEIERTLDREFVRVWRARPIADITTLEISAVIKAMRARSGVYGTFNAFRILRQMFRWAISTQEYGSLADPTAPLDADTLIGKRDARDRWLNDKELPEVWAAGAQLDYPYQPLFKMLVLTGQRLNEVARMSWDEVDFDKALWTIPASRMKGGIAHVVPLAPDALALLSDLNNPPTAEQVDGRKAIPLWTQGSCVFSSTLGKVPVSGFSKFKGRLDDLVAKARAERRAGKGTAPEEQDQMEAWVLHDIRRTVRTNFSALPVPDDVREAVVAHKRPGIRGTYDLYDRLAEKHTCLRLWEARLRTILAPPPPADVADLNAARKRRNIGKP
jgi:integrase